MPKISNNDLYVSHDDIRLFYKIEIYYNQDYGFYALLPAEYNEQYDLMDRDEMKKFNAVNVYKGRSTVTQQFKRAVSCVTEGETLEGMRKLINHLADSKVNKTPVIIIYFEPDRNSIMGDSKELPKIGMKLGITYCVKTQIGDNKPIYNIYEEREWGGKKETTRTEVHISSGWRNERYTIIADTPENRKFLETLYKAFDRLIEQMQKFTASEDAVLNFIASKQKLLSLNINDGK